MQALLDRALSPPPSEKLNPTSLSSAVRLRARERQFLSAAERLTEKIVSFVVDDDERGEIDDLDLPNRLHSELLVFEHLDFLDAVLRQPRCRSSDRPEIESSVQFARFGDLLRAIPLRQ